MARVATGLDVFRENDWKDYRHARVGLLCNPASVDHGFRPASHVVSGVLGKGLRALFGPQHGYGAEDQDNMVETGHGYDTALGVPVFSLYSESREPRPDMLEGIDVLLVDLQDVGTRVYTFASTMLLCMRAAATWGKTVVVLDRPNPLGGLRVEGNLLSPDMHSFVGPARLPMRHGLTMGELAVFFRQTLHVDVDLKVIRMNGWRRDMVWRDTGLRWVMPSPNMPSPETAFVYPGQVLWEGTNVSEGRGTCRPFELFGAPFLRPERVMQGLPREATEGAVFQPASFRPTFHKWAHTLCRGFFIHVLDERLYRPYFASIALVSALLRDGGDRFRWRDPPYEYEYERRPIDLILGDVAVRKALERGEDPRGIREGWRDDEAAFEEQRTPCLLY